jgi:hypothetical protein
MTLFLSTFSAQWNTCSVHIQVDSLTLCLFSRPHLYVVIIDVIIRRLNCLVLFVSEDYVHPLGQL